MDFKEMVHMDQFDFILLDGLSISTTFNWLKKK